MSLGQPNILFIQTDQLAANVLRAYGDQVCQAPHIDKLASEGVVFDSAYCNFPLCAPSRFSMATGLLASKIGAYDNAAEMPASIPTYAHYMRNLGYQTCLSGKMHFIGPDQLHGFEKRLTGDIYPADFEWAADWEATAYGGATDIRMLTQSGICARSVQIDYDDEITHRAVRELFDIARSDDERPFFFQVSYTHPHDPYLCLREHWDRYDDVYIPPPRIGEVPENEADSHSLRARKLHGLDEAAVTDEIVARARRAYYGAVSYIDDQVGKLLAALHQSGQAENTIIVFTSDHGEMLGERGLWLKKSFFEQALQVPLIVHAPGRFRPGRVRDVCSLVDLLPTFVGLASDGGWNESIELLDGTDLTPLILSLREMPERPLYAELLCEGVLAPIFTIRRGRYKFITSKGDPDQLYDLEADPAELSNLAGQPSLKDVVRALQLEADDLWDSESLSKQIRLSQKRRHFIHRAHSQGTAASWDFLPGGSDDPNWYRGGQNYNDWAFSCLPEQKDQ